MNNPFLDSMLEAIELPENFAESATYLKVYSFFGVKFGVLAGDKELLQKLSPPVWHPEIQESSAHSFDELLTFFWVEPFEEERYQLWREKYPKGIHDFKDLVKTLDSVASHEVGMRAPGYYFVHAGVVELDGCLMLFPGRSFSGKSTLVEYLAQQGAVYYSDEYALVDDEGQITAYLRPLSLRDGQRIAQRHLDPVEAGFSLARKPAIAKGVYFLNYSKSNPVWEVKELSAGECLLKLLENSLSIEDRPQQTMDALAKVAHQAKGYAGERPDVEETFKLLKERVRECLEHSST